MIFCPIFLGQIFKELFLNGIGGYPAPSTTSVDFPNYIWGKLHIQIQNIFFSRTIVRRKLAEWRQWELLSNRLNTQQAVITCSAASKCKIVKDLQNCHIWHYFKIFLTFWDAYIYNACILMLVHMCIMHVCMMHVPMICNHEPWYIYVWCLIMMHVSMMHIREVIIGSYSSQRHMHMHKVP